MPIAVLGIASFGTGNRKSGRTPSLADETLLNLTQDFGESPLFVRRRVEKDGQFLPVGTGAVNGEGRSEARLDARHGVHSLFDFAASVIDAPNDDAFLRPPGDDQLAVGKKTHVSRFEPTVGAKDAVGLGVAEISRRNHRPANLQMPHGVFENDLPVRRSRSECSHPESADRGW